MWGVEESKHLERVNTYECNIYRGWVVCMESIGILVYEFREDFSWCLYECVGW